MALVIFCRDCHRAVHRSPARAPGSCPGCGLQSRSGDNWWTVDRPEGTPTRRTNSGFRKGHPSWSCGHTASLSLPGTPSSAASGPFFMDAESPQRIHTGSPYWTSLSEWDKDFLRRQRIRPWEGQIDGSQRT